MFFRFVAKESVSRKDVERNSGDYLDSARNQRIFAMHLEKCNLIHTCIDLIICFELIS